MTKESSLGLRICDWVTKYSIYVAIFLIPIFFLPWTSDALDFNKQALLVALVIISLFSWMLKVLISGRFEFNKSKMHAFVGVLFLMYAFSTIFSVFKYGSFWGWPQNSAESLLSSIAIISAYFIISNTFTKKEVFTSTITLFCSVLVAEVIGVLQLFGVYALFAEVTKSINFNTIGSVGSLGFLAAILLPLSMLVVMTSTKKKWKLLFGAHLLISFVLLSLINYSIIWWVVIFASALVLIFTTIKRDIFDSRWMVLPMFFLAISVFFVLLSSQLGWFTQKANEIFLSQNASLQIAAQGVKENPLFGSGLGTFAYDFAKFKDVSLSSSSLWSVTFGEAKSKILNDLTTTGILGLLAFLILIGFAIFSFVKFILKDRGIEDGSENKIFYWVLLLGVAICFVSQCFMFFLYYSNLTLSFVFFFLIACGVVLMSYEKKSYELKSSSLVTLIVTFAFTLVLIFGLGLLILDGQRYVAEVNYYQGLVKWSAGDTEGATKNIETAASLNQSSDLYFRQLSQIYLSQLSTKIENAPENPTKEEADVIQGLVANSINAAKFSTDLNSKSVSNWSVRGYVYQNLFGILNDAGTWAMTSYDEALKLDPNNPYLYFQKGNVNYILAVRTSSDESDQAAEYLNKAKDSLEKAVELNASYSNALYSLGIVYDALGDKQKAIEKFTLVQELNPDNTDIATILTNLKAGKSISSMTNLPTEAPATESVDGVQNEDETEIPSEE